MDLRELNVFLFFVFVIIFFKLLLMFVVGVSLIKLDIMEKLFLNLKDFSIVYVVLFFFRYFVLVMYLLVIFSVF